MCAKGFGQSQPSKIDKLVESAVRYCHKRHPEGLDSSPIFATPTHPEAKGIGLYMLTKACKSTQMKVFALGGINENNYQKCLDVGASGIAAISMFKK
ncbi:MAG: thiamine phosphate synthase [Nostoc sp.]|uniref:thiamine phosphate synthase n=1 Tax=unclassified Nostoc TaxID=2593658 RepID=UPI002FF7EA65